MSNYKTCLKITSRLFKNYSSQELKFLYIFQLSFHSLFLNIIQNSTITSTTLEVEGVDSTKKALDTRRRLALHLFVGDLG